MFLLGDPVRGRGRFSVLLHMDSNYLSDVRILHWDVNWHGVLPFLFIFVYFFTATRNLALRARGL